MSNWTTANIPDQTGKLAIVTGATGGTGYETALELARKGALHVMRDWRSRRAGLARPGGVAAWRRRSARESGGKGWHPQGVNPASVPVRCRWRPL